MAYPRPGSSGGHPARGSSMANFDKRMSKDDMFFNNARQKHTFDKRMSRDDMHIRSRKTSMSQYRVPVRGSSLTPEHSPHSVIHEVSIPVRLQTPESMKSGGTPKGMAMSKTQLPPPDTSRWQAQVPPASTPAAKPAQPSAVEAAPTGSLQRKKTTGRRKLFGLFGGGKKPEDAQSSIQSEAGKSTTTLGRLRAASTSTVNVSAKGAPTRSHTQTERKQPKYKPIMIRSQTLPYNGDESDAPPATAVRPNLRPKMSEPYIRQGNAYHRPHANRGVPPVPSLLDVKIPDTTLERYSVMFSDVLKEVPNEVPRQEPVVPLLARRQATLERLKPTNSSMESEMAEKEKARQRRATSPQPAPSPRLNLFPMPPAGRATPVMDTPSSQSRLSRSNTSPGRLPTPTQATFDAQKGSTAAKVPQGRNLIVPNPFEGPSPQATPRLDKDEPEPIYPTDTSFRFGPDESGTILESPTEMEAPEFAVAQPFKPALREPQWQMVSPPLASTASTTASTTASVQSSVTSGGRRRSPSAASSVTTRTHTTKPSSEIDDAEAAFQNAVEVSIARQISISRQQRQLLRPLQTRRAPAPAGAMATAGPLGVKVGKSPSPTRRLTDEGTTIKETKISTPTLVNPRQQPVNPEHLLVNRKSSWAVVEGDE